MITFVGNILFVFATYLDIKTIKNREVNNIRRHFLDDFQNQAVPNGCDLTVKQIDAALQTALIRISGKFGAHLKALNLSNEQLQTIRMVCQSDI
ncbi:hypothetical protein TELCIR_04475 [Teladorsagia circumcincta]|uniref:Uncharacterized protein n=1 Tax=Teladorsagia circumcincta TaxID=45464 RepID=A0A2G9UVM0_TELCI|nr:hypothetical protein TELCIR_04475 [Teladorsagia circumcincta]